MKPDTQPHHPHNAQSDDKLGQPEPARDGVLQNEYDGEAAHDGIPANGTRPVAPRGPDEIGA